MAVESTGKMTPIGSIYTGFPLTLYPVGIISSSKHMNYTLKGIINYIMELFVPDRV